jgi:hypothetical protein
VLGLDVVSRHSTPDIGSRCPWTPKHLTHVSVLPHLYTMPDLHHGFLSKIAFLRRSETQVRGNVVVLAMLAAVRGPFVVMNRLGQLVITSTKVFDVTPESGSTTRSR